MIRDIKVQFGCVMTKEQGLYFTTTIKEAMESAPALVLNRVITALAPEGYTLDRINFQFPEYYANVSSLVEKTPRATIQALIMITAYSSFAPYLAGTGKPEVDRWDFCFNYIDRSLGWMASKFFVDVAYNNETKDFFKTMAEELRESFSERAKSHDWIGEETQVRIQEKIDEIIPKIGYPDHVSVTLSSTINALLIIYCGQKPDLLDPTALADYYSPINITSSLYDNVVSIRRWVVCNAWTLLLEKTDIRVWPEFQVHSFIPNARYGFNYNHIVIPSGFTQAPFFYPDAPSYLTYGSAGTIVGHEITHGFDSNGRLWNNDRQYKTWWDDQSVAAFENRTECFIQQYSKFEAIDYLGENASNTTEKAFNNGNLTLAENIADAGGINSAWLAWQKHEQQSPSQKLPGLQALSKEQLFFVGFGQSFCSKYTKENVRSSITMDAHSLPYARILGPTQNSKAFRDAFKCQSREPTCEIW
jgi:endothelin-converting enzyme